MNDEAAKDVADNLVDSAGLADSAPIESVATESIADATDTTPSIESQSIESRPIEGGSIETGANGPGSSESGSAPVDEYDAEQRDPVAGETGSVDSSDSDDEPDEVPPPSQPAPRYGIVALAMFVFLVSLGYLATALYPDWVINHPVGLIALSARIRNLLGALGTGMPIPVFFIVGGARLALAYVTCHLIGRAYGERIYYVFGRYLGVTRDQIEQVNSMFDKVEWLVVPWFVGSNLVAAVTGVRRMDWRRLAVLTGIGIAIRLALLWFMSVLFERQLDIILDWIARYQQRLLLATVGLAIVTVAFNLRRGKNFEM